MAAPKAVTMIPVFSMVEKARNRLMSRSVSAYRTPMAAVTAPAAMVISPSQDAVPGSSRNANSAIP